MQAVEVIENPGGQALLITEDGYTYKMCTVSGPSVASRVYTWTCAIRDCRAQLKTAVTAGRHSVVADDAAAESATAATVVHSHNSSPIRDMFVTVGHASGNVYLPPTLWR